MFLTYCYTGISNYHLLSGIEKPSLKHFNFKNGY
nr:MAG TPA: hypothetical protein [Caudoviricetes sp.]